jgi:trk system potassium uptake protein TrkA
MKVLIAGGGQVGALIARRLTREGNDVVVVEPSPARCAQLEAQLDARVVAGSAASILTLREAGIAGAEMVIAVTDSDEVNLLVCLLAQVESRARIKVTRLRTEEAEQWREVAARAGVHLDLVIHAETELADRIMRVIRVRGVSDILEFAGGEVRLVGMTLEKGNPAIGRSLEELSRAGTPAGTPSDSIIAMIFRRDQVVIPRGSEVLRAGDHVYVATSRASFDATLRFMGLEPPAPIHRVFVLGGGQLGVRLARLLEAQGVQVKVFEHDAARAERIAAMLARSVVIHADGTDQTALEEAGIADIDAFLSLTNDDEDNIIASLLARRLGVRKVVARVNRLNYVGLAQRLGISTTVSPRLATVDRILQFVRRGRVLSVTTFGEEEAEAIELIASAGSRYVGRKLAAVRFPPGAIIGSIVRSSGEVLVPRGSTVVRPGDRLIVFALERIIPQLEAAFLASGGERRS